ncbi:DUF7916 family protein [Dolosicoccus paucivorans]
MKRLFDLTADEVRELSKDQLLDSLKLCEGRVMMSELMAHMPAILGDVSNAEVAAAFGADIIMVNTYDTTKPFIAGIDHEEPLKEVGRLTGRVIAATLEPVDLSVQSDHYQEELSPGRLATLDNVAHLIDQGVQMVLLTGNPSTFVSNEAILEAIRAIKTAVGDKIVIASGKMHSSGMVNESSGDMVQIADVDGFIDAGADIVLVPAPGTVPGFTTEKVESLVQHIQRRGKLALTSIGTSQEGADVDTIRAIALQAKMAGADIHHIGDCGMGPGMAIPENIMAYSTVIRGRRHTYRQMARSLLR